MGSCPINLYRKALRLDEKFHCGFALMPVQVQPWNICGDSEIFIGRGSEAYAAPFGDLFGTADQDAPQSHVPDGLSAMPAKG